MNYPSLATTIGLTVSVFLGSNGSGVAQTDALPITKPNVLECVGLMFSNPDLHKELCGVNDFASGAGGSNFGVSSETECPEGFEFRFGNCKEIEEPQLEIRR